MKLVLTRKIYTTRSTIGDLTVDGKFLCHILEDPVRPAKIKGITAISAGTYQIIISWSPRFRQQMPLLENVPGFEGIRIHPGNTPADTLGCLLPGRTKATDRVNSSRDAYQELFRLLKSETSAGRKPSLRIIEGGISPFMKGVATAPPKKGTAFLVDADPLRIRSKPDSSDLSNIIGRLPFGMIVTATGKKTSPGWVEVQGTLEEKPIRGFVSTQFLEAVPKPTVIDSSDSPAPSDSDVTAPQELHRVAVASLNLRSQPAVLTDETIVASLARNLLVRKLAATDHPLWWQVAVVVHGKPLEGYLNSSYLTPDGPPTGTMPAVPTSGEVSISEKALQLILDFEGMDQPSRWPGQASGISIGHGYDLGYHTHDDLMGDWGDHLSAAHLSRLATAIGKRGTSAKNIASRFRGITITKSAAGTVFMRCTVPKIRLWVLKTFPGILALPPDVQGALTSLVYNRGTSMTGDRRSEMRDIRDTVASRSLSVPEKITRIAASLRAMKRIWPKSASSSGHPGIRRRREAEAALVEAAVVAPIVSPDPEPVVVPGGAAEVANFLNHAAMLARLRDQRKFLRSAEKLARADDKPTRAAMRRHHYNLRHIKSAIDALEDSISFLTEHRKDDAIQNDPLCCDLCKNLTRLSIRDGRVTANTPETDPLTGHPSSAACVAPTTAPLRLQKPDEGFLTLETFIELFGSLFADWKKPGKR